MDISGVLVHIQPDQADFVRSQLNNISGVEIHATTDDGRLVVTIEKDDGSMVDTMNSFHDIKGVLSASLIYHHFDEDIMQ